MTSPLAKRMREIREFETSGRHEFSQVLDVNKKTIESIEQSGRAPKGELLEKICEVWPKYTLWLMTGKTEIEAGQTSPELEGARINLGTQGQESESRQA